MITWLQTFFLKHNKWLFGGLLVVIIVTFVLTIGPQSFFGGSGSAEKRRLQFHGYDLASEADQRTMAQHAEVSSFLNPELQIGRDQIMKYAYIRVAALGMADKLGIPAPTEENLKTFIQSLRAFQDPVSNAFSAEVYNRNKELIENSGRFSPNILSKVLREDYRIAEVRQALGGPDYTLPFELDQAFIDAKSSYNVALAHFNLNDFNPDITSTDEDLLAFYNENPSRYEIAEQISVTALKFRAEAYVSEIEDPEGSVLEAYFAANKSKYQPEEPTPEATEEGEEAVEQQEVELPDVLETVIEDWKFEQATTLAARKCEQFSVQLWQQKIELGSPAYDNLLASFSVAQEIISPYSRGETPRASGLPFQLFESVWAYARNSNRFFSDLVSTSDGAALLVINELIEARQPTFEEVKDAVSEAYLESEKRRLFAERGKELKTALEDGLVNGTFETAAQDLGLEFVDIDPFPGDQVPFSMRRAQLWEQSRFLEVGSLTPMIMNNNRGTFVYVEEKTIPEITEDNEDYLSFVDLRGSRSDNAMGWARLRQIADQGLESLFPQTTAAE
jgi:peptidyl-prolyl cis-trans isomerase D